METQLKNIVIASLIKAHDNFNMLALLSLLVFSWLTSSLTVSFLYLFCICLIMLTDSFATGVKNNNRYSKKLAIPRLYL
jgi:hypothetical protein